MKHLKTLSLVLLLFILSGCAASSKPKVISVPAPLNKTLTYNDYLKTLSNGDTNINYLGFRLAYTETDSYYPYGFTITDKLQDEADKLFNSGDTEGALAKVDEILNRDYTDAMAHFHTSKYYKKLGNKKKSEFHMKMFQELVGSILSSGTGTDASGAMTVITVREEYVVLNYLGFKALGQALIEFEGSSIDKLSTVDKNGNKKDYYFIVDIPLKKLEESLSQ